MSESDRGTIFITAYGSIVLETCCRCKTPFAMSQPVYRAAQERKESFTFYCPNGHPQTYVTGETTEEKLRRERDRLKQNEAFLESRVNELLGQRDHAERRVSAARGQITKLKNRASKGVCPCCNRHFTDLERHMSTKHPGFMQEPDATAGAAVN